MHSTTDIKEPIVKCTEFSSESLDSPKTKDLSTSQAVAEDRSSTIEDGVEGLDPPDGGFRAWLVVAAGFITYFTTFGFLNAFGVFQVYYTKNILSHMSSSQIAWIGSTQIFLLFIGGVFVGPIFDRKGTKILFIPGTVIFTTSLIFTSFSTKYYQFMLSQGILLGVADAMLFYPTISVMSHWFNKRRGLALGIVVSGSSFGGAVWPIIIERLLAQLSFAWTIRTIALICLVLLAPCCFLVVPRTQIGAHSTSAATDLTGLFRDLRYLCLVFGYVFVIWGMISPYYFIPTYGIARGVSNAMSSYLVSILNAGSLIGRIASGYCADRLGVYNTTTCCALVSGVVMFCMTQFRSLSGLIAFTCCFGFFSGGLISLQSACVAQITPDLQVIGIKIGFVMSISSIGALTGAPIGGALVLDDGKDYTFFAVFCAITLLVGAASVGASRLLQEKRLIVKI